jgi:hypothetical protein
MRINPERSEVWYQMISEFLESQAMEADANYPGSLVVALCRVLVDASEAIDVEDSKKLEAIARFIANEMGYEDALILFGKDAKSINIC